MPTRNGEASVGEAAKSVADHASSIVRLELELAALELKRKVVRLGLGIGLALGAGLFAFFALAFALAAAAAAVAIVLPWWAALLTIFGFCLFLVSGPLLFVALGAIKKGTPPVPEQAIQEENLSTEAIKSDGR